MGYSVIPLLAILLFGQISPITHDRRIYVVAPADQVAANAALDAVGFGPNTFINGVVLKQKDPTKGTPDAYYTEIQETKVALTAFEAALTGAGITFVSVVKADLDPFLDDSETKLLNRNYRAHRKEPSP